MAAEAEVIVEEVLADQAGELERMVATEEVRRSPERVTLVELATEPMPAEAVEPELPAETQLLTAGTAETVLRITTMGLQLLTRAEAVLVLELTVPEELEEVAPVAELAQLGQSTRAAEAVEALTGTPELEVLES
jgi:hypothetical protein